MGMGSRVRKHMWEGTGRAWAPGMQRQVWSGTPGGRRGAGLWGGRAGEVGSQQIRKVSLSI